MAFWGTWMRNGGIDVCSVGCEVAAARIREASEPAAFGRAVAGAGARVSAPAGAGGVVAAWAAAAGRKTPIAPANAEVAKWRRLPINECNPAMIVQERAPPPVVQAAMGAPPSRCCRRHPTADAQEQGQFGELSIEIFDHRVNVRLGSNSEVPRWPLSVRYEAGIGPAFAELVLRKRAVSRSARIDIRSFLDAASRAPTALVIATRDVNGFSRQRSSAQILAARLACSPASYCPPASPKTRSPGRRPGLLASTI